MRKPPQVVNDADIEELVWRALHVFEKVVISTPEDKAEVVRELAFMRAGEIGASNMWARTLAKKAHPHVLWSSRLSPRKVG